MSKMLLSILIPTVEGRESCLRRLQSEIIGQVEGGGSAMMQLAGGRPREGNVGVMDFGDVEIVGIWDRKEMAIGEKREKLYAAARGKYSWQIDDDDLISPEAIELILEAIKQKPDCITFEEHINIDGKIEKSNHSLSYGDWEGEGGKELWDGFHYHRTPFFKSVIKTEIARSVPIPHIRFGEDHQWAQALKPHLKTEVHIPEQLYRYIHISTPFNERYGIA